MGSVGRLLCAGVATVLLGCGWYGADTGVAGYGVGSVPTVTGREASAAVVRAFLEPAPEGHAWSYGLDWDDSIVGKCLRPEPAPEGRTYLRPELIAALQATEPPAGYQWWSDRAGGGTVGLCVLRVGCPYGRVRDRQECIVPR